MGFPKHIEYVRIAKHSVLSDSKKGEKRKTGDTEEVRLCFLTGLTIILGFFTLNEAAVELNADVSRGSTMHISSSSRTCMVLLINGQMRRISYDQSICLHGIVPCPKLSVWSDFCGGSQAMAACHQF